jgi:predicted nucleic acid-binding protein
VIDASVAAKWIAPEAGSDRADALLDDDLLVPDLLFAEVANVLWKKVSRGEMTSQAADLAARWLVQVPLVAADGASLTRDALALAVRLGHPAYDCFYLALALRTGRTLVTADRRLAQRCGQPDVPDLAGRVRWLGETTD